MPCYAPLTAYRARWGGITFQRSASFTGDPMKLPCGQCTGCRLERSRQWAMRCLHEAQLHDENMFITLTYEEGKVPHGGSCVKTELSGFCKRLHNRLLRSRGRGIRYYGCSEYGENGRRPHYHVLVFGYVFKDGKVWSRQTATKDALYSSAELSSLWPSGLSLYGAVTFNSAAYVARYCMKKITGPDAWQLYQKFDYSTGEIFDLEPEGAVMSKGIGKKWFEKYGRQSYNWDSIIINAKEVRPPRYYDYLFEEVDAKRLKVLKAKRRTKAKAGVADQTPERRKVREAVALATLKQKVRIL